MAKDMSERQTVSDRQTTLLLDGRQTMSEIHVDEALLTLSNGVIGIRGHFCEGYGGDLDDNMTFVNGFFNTYPYHYEENSGQFPQSGQIIVKVIDTTAIDVIVSGQAVNLTDMTLICLKRRYDMKANLATREATYRMTSGTHVVILEERTVSRNFAGLAMTRLSVSSPDHTGPVRLISHIRMPKVKRIVALDPRLSQGRTHLELVSKSVRDGLMRLTAKTTETDMSVTAACVHDRPVDVTNHDDALSGIMEDNLAPGHAVRVVKTMFFQTTHGVIKETIDDLVNKNLSFDDIIGMNLEVDSGRRTSVPMVSDPSIARDLAYNIHQLEASGGMSERTQISAKGITGEGYEGHYFWDTEIYMVPYFILNSPEKAKRLLTYRIRTLDKARLEARKLGVSRGAKIPWRTIDGSEASPYFPAGSAQIHINSDVAHALMQYVNATGDTGLLKNGGFELLVETARFIMDYGHFKDGRFHINGVTGPDEYTVLVNDNYYTNAMAKAHFTGICDIWDSTRHILSDVGSSIGFTDEECRMMRKAAEGMTLLVDKKRAIALQDSTFDTLPELDLDTIPADAHPMLLFYHPMFIYRHQILKQADAVLAMVLLGENDSVLFKNTVNHYHSRTTHDSSLSKCMYGIALFQTGEPVQALDYWKESLRLDLDNLRDHTQHGLHVANLGGTYLTLVYGLFGLVMAPTLTLRPARGVPLASYGTTILWRDHPVWLEVRNGVFILKTDTPLDVIIDGTFHHVESMHQMTL
jgi:alpha,alpha-trehalose phosphorylase